MKDSRNDDLEKLRQQQLINSILSQKQLETDALIQATKENMQKPIQDIEKRKKEILNSKIEEQKERDKEQLEKAKNEKVFSGINKIVDKYNDEDKLLEKWNEEERQEREARRKKVDEILQEIDPKKHKKSTTQKAKERLEAIEREKYRKKYNEEQAKRRSLLEQLECLREKQRVKKSATHDKEKSSKPIKEEKSKVKDNTETKAENFSKTQDTPKKTISIFKSIQATRAYQKNMDFYSLSKIKHFLDITIGKTFNSSKNKRLSFEKALECSVNEKKANRDAARKANIRYEPRVL